MKLVHCQQYEGCTAENFDGWSDRSVYVCNIATNARHGWVFWHGYVHNPDIPSTI